MLLICLLKLWQGAAFGRKEIGLLLVVNKNAGIPMLQEYRVALILQNMVNSNTNNRKFVINQT